MEDLEQALLFLLHIIFSELSFSLRYKAFGKADRRLNRDQELLNRPQTTLSAWQCFFFPPLQNPCPAAHSSAHTAPGITFEPLLFFGRSSDTAHKAGHMCREPGRSRGRSPGSCLRPEASVKPLFSCFHYNRFWHFSKCTTALSHHIWTDILHLSSALLPSVSEP